MVNTEHIKKQTELDIDNSLGEFVVGNLLSYIFPTVFVAVISALGIAGFMAAGSPAPARVDGSVYILEYLLLAFVGFLAVFFFVYAPYKVLNFGIKYKYSLNLSYKGGSPLFKPMFYGGTLTSHRLMKILLFPIIKNAVLVVVFVLFVLLLLAGVILGISPLTYAAIVLLLGGVGFYVFLGLKLSMVPYYVADDDTNKYTLKKTMKASWYQMDGDAISDYASLNAKSWGLVAVILLPAIAGIGFLLYFAAGNFGTLLTNAGISLVDTLSNLPIELPDLSSLLPAGLPKLAYSDTLFLISYVSALVGIVATWILKVIFVDNRKTVLNANFYNVIKTRMDAYTYLDE
ncbi:MAG: hypothetical protein LBQ40_04840 [Clostridiales bacterium]|jgi:hypothetical protein|nr:hypothetical protein [Clostridiales bacterium]